MAVHIVCSDSSSACANRRALGTTGTPNARADAGGPSTLPRPAAPKPIEPSGPVGAARASHCIHPDLPGGGNAPDQLNRVMSENGSERASASRINSATAYSNIDRDFSAMAAGSHGDHAPISVELSRNCGRRETDNCQSGRQSEGAHTIANHSVVVQDPSFISEAPATGGTPGLRVPLGGNL
jgi:hypothetical protein